MEKDLAVRNETTDLINPEQVVEVATAQAKLLMQIVEQTKCYQEISGKKYLQVEAWELIGAFNRTHAETGSVNPIIRDDTTIGYQAHVQLWKDGIVVGGAIMPCYFTENCCKGKDGDAKHKACMSAAQTFATSKAYRMNFSYVAILAGFQPLPADEVTDDMKQPADKSQHWCEEHDTDFFKKGKMKSFAHPVEGAEPPEWCHERTPENRSESKPKAEVIEIKGEIVMVGETEKPPEVVNVEQAEKPITEEQIRKLHLLLKETGTDLAAFGKFCNKDKGWGIRDMKDLKQSQYDIIIKAFEKGKA